VIEYDLGRDFREFHTAFGISDEAPSTAKTRFEVFLDGTSAATNDVGLGESVPVTLGKRDRRAAVEACGNRDRRSDQLWIS